MVWVSLAAEGGGSALKGQRLGIEHNFRYPRIRELTVDNDAIALGSRRRTF